MIHNRQNSISDEWAVSWGKQAYRHNFRFILVYFAFSNSNFEVELLLMKGKRNNKTFWLLAAKFWRHFLCDVFPMSSSYYRAVSWKKRGYQHYYWFRLVYYAFWILILKSNYCWWQVNEIIKRFGSWWQHFVVIFMPHVSIP